MSKSFQTSVDSVNYVRTEQIPATIPEFSYAAFFPTESGFDLTFGIWEPYNSTIYGKQDVPVEDRKWQYEIATQRWTDAGITLKNWFQTNSPKRLTSSMTIWIPSLKKGFLFGGDFVWINETSLQVTGLEEHSGLITYDQATNTWTNETTPLGGISTGGLVHLTTATDEVLIQFGGKSKWATRLVFHLIYRVSPRKMLIVSGREIFPRSTSTAQTNQSGIPNIYHLMLWRQLLDSYSALFLNQLRMAPAIKSTSWGALKLVLQ